jgi:hypothetical protein
LDDLNDEDLLVACLENKNENLFCLYIWKGTSVQIETEELNIYLSDVKSFFFNEEDHEKVVIIEETPYSESDDFMNLL